MKDDSRDWLPRGGRQVYYTLDEQHQPQPVDDVLTWGRWMEDERRKPGGGLLQVADTTLPGRLRVSTIFMGLDYNFLGGPPLLFETMAFYPRGRRPHDLWLRGIGGKPTLLAKRGRRLMREFVQLRYSTWGGAMAGHAGVVQAARAYRRELLAAYASGDERARSRVARAVFERTARTAR
jgi:hypothetical protein